MGSGCSIGASCVAKAKAPQRLSATSVPRFHKTSPFIKLPSSPTEDTPYDAAAWTADKTASKMSKWREMCTLKLGGGSTMRGTQSNAPNLEEVMLEKTKQDETEALSEFALTHPAEFSKKLTSGPPPALRWAAWKAALQTYRYFIAGKYDELRQQKMACKWLSTISHDVARTFAGCIYDKEALENILASYAMYNPAVGYCQGMNFLAGLILIVASDSNEEEAFWGFVALMEKRISTDKLSITGANKLYTANFPLVYLLEKLFDHVLCENAPNLKAHFEAISLPANLWLHQWISSLFLYTFPMQFCVRLWDALLGNGVSFMVSRVFF